MRPARLLAGIALAALVAGCGIGAPSAVPPSEAQPSGSPIAASGAIELTRGLVEAALRPSGLALIVPSVPFRPPESPALTDAPRAVYQVVLADPTAGFLVVYEFPDATSAEAAGHDQATWLASGPGAIQSSPGATHVIRVVGSTLVTFSYPPGGSQDPQEPLVAAALRTVGRGIEVSP